MFLFAHSYWWVSVQQTRCSLRERLTLEAQSQVELDTYDVQRWLCESISKTLEDFVVHNNPRTDTPTTFYEIKNKDLLVQEMATDGVGVEAILSTITTIPTLSRNPVGRDWLLLHFFNIRLSFLFLSSAICCLLDYFEIIPFAFVFFLFFFCTHGL